MSQDVKLRLSVSGQAQVVGALGEVERATDGATGALRTLAGALGVGLSVKAVIDAADAVTTLHNSLKLATGSAQAASVAYERLFQIAQSSRTSFTDLGATFASISRAAGSLGLSQERLLGVTQAIGNAMTISGGSAESMKDALVQLGQGLASGTLRGDELNSVLEQTPRLAQALADGLGVGIGELRKLGEAGSLTAQQVIGALEKSAPQLAKEVQGATLTVGQAFTLLSNSATKFIGEADKATGASNTLANAMKSLSGAIDTAGEFIRKHEVAFGLIGGTLGSAAAAAVGIVAVGTAIKGVAIAVGLLDTALLANPVVLTLLGIGAVAGGIAAANNAVRNSMAGMANEITDLTRRINEAQKQLDSTSSRGEFTRGLQERLAAMRAARAELQQTLAAAQAGQLDTRAEDARFQRSAQQYAQQQQSLKDLAEVRAKLANVDKDYLPTLEKLQRARELGTISEKDYIAQVSELAKQTYKASDEQKKAAQAAEQNKERVKSLTEAVDAKVAAGQLELQQLQDHDGTQQQLTKAQEYALDVMEKLRTGEVKLTTAQAEQLRVKLEKLDADERERMRLEADAKWAQQSADESARAIEQAQQQAASLQEQAKRQQEANEAIGLSAVAVADLEAARQRDTAASKDQLAAAIETASPNLAAAYREQAQALRDLADAKTAGAVKQQIADAQKQSLDDLRQAINQSGQALADALMRGGKSAGRQLLDYFKTLTVRMAVQALIVSPLQSVLGLNAGGASGGSAGLGAFGAVGNAVSLYRAGSGLYSAGLAGTAGSYVSAAGALTGSVSVGAYGAGMGMTASEAAAAAAAYNSAGVAGVGSSISAGASAGSALSSVGAAIPYVAVALVIANALGLFKSTKQVGGGLLGTVGDTNSIQAYDLMRRGGSLFSGPDYSYGAYAADPAVVKAIATGVSSMLASTRAQAAALGVGNNISSFSATLGSDLIHPDTGGTGIKLDGLTAEQAQTKISQAMQDLAEKMAAQALGPAGQSLARAGETAVQTMSRLTGSLATVNGAFYQLGRTMLQAGLDSAATAQSLVDMFGGTDAFSTSVSAYYQSIYSDSDKLSLAQQHISDVFRQYLMKVPASTAEYKKLVEAQDLGTESGRAMYATLVQLAPAYAEVRNALDEQAAAASEASARLAEEAAQKAAAVAQERTGLEQQLLQLQGNTAELRRRELAALDPSNRSLQERIYILQEAQAAEQAAAQATQAAAQQRVSLEQQLLQLQGNTAELRRRELAALDPSNRSLQQQIYTLQEYQAAQQAAAQAAQEAEAQRQALLQQQAGMEQTLLQLQGATATLRQRELAALDPSLRALQERIYVLQDAQAAEQAATQAAQAAAQQREGLEQQLLQLQGDTAELRRRELAALDPGNRALQERIYALQDEQAAAADALKLRDAWKSLGETIADEIRRIRGLSSTGTARSFVELQAQFATTTAQARAGDQDAAKTLPELSKALLEAASDSAATAGDLARIQAATAASLEQTMRALSALGVEVPAFADGGNFSGGLRLVGERGPELEITGPSRIYSAEQTAALLRPRADTARLEAQVERLTQLLEEHLAEAQATTTYTARTARILERVTPDGDAVAVRTAE